MLRDLKHIIFSIMTVLLVAPAAGAQVYRVAIASNASRTDYVDVMNTTSWMSSRNFRAATADLSITSTRPVSIPTMPTSTKSREE